MPGPREPTTLRPLAPGPGAATRERATTSAPGNPGRPTIGRLYWGPPGSATPNGARPPSATGRSGAKSGDLMAAFERHVFVCTNSREAGHPRGCCAARESPRVRELLKAEIERRGLRRRIRINQAGCLDQCEHGVTVVVYPEGVWYGFVRPEDVPEIVERHLVGGVPVERLRLPDACVNTERCPHRAGGVQLGLPGGPAGR